MEQVSVSVHCVRNIKVFHVNENFVGEFQKKKIWKLSDLMKGQNFQEKINIPTFNSLGILLMSYFVFVVVFITFTYQNFVLLGKCKFVILEVIFTLFC